MSLFIGNIAGEISQKELEDLFSKYGKCEIKYKSIFAFAEYSSDKEAEQAMQELNKKEINGRALSIEWSKKSKNYISKRYSRENSTYSMRCYNCNRRGHFARDCPEIRRSNSRNRYPGRDRSYHSRMRSRSRSHRSRSRSRHRRRRRYDSSSSRSRGRDRYRRRDRSDSRRRSRSRSRRRSDDSFDRSSRNRKSRDRSEDNGEKVSRDEWKNNSDNNNNNDNDDRNKSFSKKSRSDNGSYNNSNRSFEQNKNYKPEEAEKNDNNITKNNTK